MVSQAVLRFCGHKSQRCIETSRSCEFRIMCSVLLMVSAKPSYMCFSASPRNPFLDLSGDLCNSHLSYFLSLHVWAVERLPFPVIGVSTRLCEGFGVGLGFEKESIIVNTPMVCFDSPEPCKMMRCAAQDFGRFSVAAHGHAPLPWRHDVN